MAQLIDKDAVVAEIKRRLWLLVPKITFHPQRVELEKLLSFLDTLEVKELEVKVKEVDLELNSFDATVCKIGSTYLKEMNKDAIANVLEPYKNGDKVKVIIIKED